MRSGSRLENNRASDSIYRLSWVVLLVFLAGLCIAAATFERSNWPSLFGDEATYLMASQSLAWDRDLLFEPADYARFVSLWDTVPEGLVLQSGDDGETITYGKPFFYPLIIAPIVWLAPVRGPFLANAVMLALAVILTARVLTHRVGRLAPLWVATLIFATVVYLYVFEAHADLFLLCCSAVALCLIFGHFDEKSATSMRITIVRWALVGALIGVVAYSRPLYAPLFIPAVVALPKGHRFRAAAGLALGALALVGLAAAVHKVNGGAWTSYGGERRGFYASSGFPGVDFPAEDWDATVSGSENAAWSEAERIWMLPRTSLSLWGWNSVYFLLGRHVGLLPYFFPIILGFMGLPRQWIRVSLLAAVAISIAAFFLYRPFNFYGGGGAIANRYLLALFPAFWFLCERRIRAWQIGLVVLVAAPFLWPAWRQPRAYPLESNRSYRFVSAAAGRFLPYETTQSHLKPAGRSDVVHGQLWVKFLTPTIRPSRDGQLLLLDSGSTGELLVGSSQPLQAITVDLATESADLEFIGTGELVSDTDESGHRTLRVDLHRPRAKHRMWWTWDDVFLYQLKLRAGVSDAERVVFSLIPSIAPVSR